MSFTCVEGHTGREIMALTCGLDAAHVVAAAADAHRSGLDLGHVIADLGHEIDDLGLETAGQGLEVAVQGRETEVDLSAVTAVERVRPDAELVGRQLVGSVHEQLGLGQGRGQSLRRLQGHRGEF